MSMFVQYWGIPKDASWNGFMERYPILFQNKNKSMRETCMCWGIECPIGWWHILVQLCNFLEFTNIDIGKKYGLAIIADQVKEKFGTLRFYYHIGRVDANGHSVELCDEDDIDSDRNREIELAREHMEMLANRSISDAETLTESTCADCGIPLDDKNRVETTGWITFICKECEIKRDEERNKLIEKYKSSEQTTETSCAELDEKHKNQDDIKE